MKTKALLAGFLLIFSSGCWSSWIINGPQLTKNDDFRSEMAGESGMLLANSKRFRKDFNDDVQLWQSIRNGKIGLCVEPKWKTYDRSKYYEDEDMKRHFRNQERQSPKTNKKAPESKSGARGG